LPPPPRVTVITPLGWYAMGGIACAAVSPMIGTLVLGRELTVTEVDRMALSCFLGPVSASRQVPSRSWLEMRVA
jgi:hypothetical protein